MNASLNPWKPIFVALSLAGLTAAGCVAGGPLAAQRARELDDTKVQAEATDEGRWPIRLVSFPSVEVLPLWPSEEDTSEASEEVVSPLAAGADAVKRGAGQVQQGFVQIGRGAKRAVATTTDYLSRPLVAVRATPGEPSLLGRMFSSEPAKDGPRTTREFFEQERLR